MLMAISLEALTSLRATRIYYLCAWLAFFGFAAWLVIWAMDPLGQARSMMEPGDVAATFSKDNAHATLVRDEARIELSDGVRVVVISDLPDADSAYLDRLIEVKILAGEHSSKVGWIRRDFIEAIGE